MNLLPAETNLDILKCLNFNQLNNCQLSNRRLCEVIVKYSKELATRKVFYSVELVVWKNYVCKDLVDYGYINPEILQLFFGDSPLKFDTNCFYLYDEDGEYFPQAYEFMYHHVVIHGCKGFYYQYPDWNMRGEMIKDEERHFIGEDVEEFCKVVEYKLDGIDPKDSGILYVCYHIGSKEPFFFEIKGPGMM
uniref:F-box domain-containing protein n=1 Tax=Meloidogyne incognita TaxID=6306 RepID=A0A914LHM1_MELIC